MGRPFNPRIRHKLDQPSLQVLATDSQRSSNPHRSHERRQRLFLNAVSSLGGFRTPASPCLAPPRAKGRRPKPFTKAVVQKVEKGSIHIGRANRALSSRTALRPSKKRIEKSCCKSASTSVNLDGGRTISFAEAFPGGAERGRGTPSKEACSNPSDGCRRLLAPYGDRRNRDPGAPEGDAARPH
jgi:hypothetical protein